MKKSIRILLVIIILSMLMTASVSGTEKGNFVKNEIKTNTEVSNTENNDTDNVTSELKNIENTNTEIKNTIVSDSETKNTENNNLENENIKTSDLDIRSVEKEDSKIEEEKETLNAGPESFVSEEFVYINPLYKDIISEEDLNKPSDIMLLSMPNECRTIESAGNEIREQLKERNETIQIIYITNETVDKTTLEKCMNEAMKHTGISTEGDYIVWQYGGYRAGAYSMIDENNRYVTDENGAYYYTFKYTLTYYTNYEQEIEMNNAVSNLLNTLKLKGSDYEKITKIYDYICTNVRYDYDQSESTLKHTAYAALINKKAVCQGYAILLYRLLLENNIDTRIIAGLGNGGRHGWNIVKIGNYYYNLDSTWDEGRTNIGYNYYLLSDKNFKYHTRFDEYLTQEFYKKYPMAIENYKNEIGNINSDAKVMLVNNVWSLVKNGIVDYSYTGLGKNEYGTWYIEKGVVNWSYKGTVLEEDKAYIIEGGKVQAVVPSNTTKVMEINKNWRMVVNGKVEYNYTGLGKNESGIWYVRNGTIKFDYTGTYKDTDGKTYIIEKNRVMTGLNKVMQIDGIWRIVVDGIVDYNYKGLGKNEYGTWYVKDGKVDFTFKGTLYKEKIAYIIEGGKVVLTTSEDKTEIMLVNGTWRMVLEGLVKYNYNGIGTNSSGMWYVKNGTINFDHTGTFKHTDGKTYIIEKNRVMTDLNTVMQVDVAWRMIKNGVIEYNYTGTGKNEYGTWFIQNGVVNFNYKDTYYEGDKAYIIEGGRVIAVVPSNTTKVIEINKTWRMVVNGKVEYNYDGIGTNESGTWYVKNGTIKFDYTGIFKNKDGKTYVIEKNRVMTHITKVMLLNDGFWRLVRNGVIEYNYTGIGKNEYGIWYLNNGIVDFNYNGNYTDTNGKIHTVINGRVVD